MADMFSLGQGAWATLAQRPRMRRAKRLWNAQDEIQWMARELATVRIMNAYLLHQFRAIAPPVSMPATNEGALRGRPDEVVMEAMHDLSPPPGLEHLAATVTASNPWEGGSPDPLMNLPKIKVEKPFAKVNEEITDDRKPTCRQEMNCNEFLAVAAQVRATIPTPAGLCMFSPSREPMVSQWQSCFGSHWRETKQCLVTVHRRMKSMQIQMLRHSQVMRLLQKLFSNKDWRSFTGQMS
eukprot:gnl/MRDRNA2_/MRDRNA2_133412_c0_seq1.p1 gnl/MRDRNA2_/MRDRNA2_133412_c0~~gnl/MRDRNA2_/MRDRNA2_133412_c0_seq1.p1  ORF type:complete len:238 (-),score=38.76 gnl/MRDRNA2_/MRDRNA2_133412_c0_seq1:557-1270(-)